MAKKGKAKNTVNKAKHTKLLNRKKAKLKKEQETRKERLKTIAQMKHSKNETL
ncbi:hypothetical protein [Kriegella aquimaris]|uniref:Uncharacterized protein n=1 Tax=Kriegella aquimaris TaxID=192904 RepID=A0A1G9QQE6_9FLAO|nr:hypothetical protein [Kriegella aquimaris]SDM13203.1 hypothetical protein SAMN04488514_105159 [Kriegella aquimaris]